MEEVLTTPIPKRNRNSNICHNDTVQIPETPIMQRIAVGTGVGVYSYERSPRGGFFRSPWAVKKILKCTNRNKSYEKRLVEEAKVLKSLKHANIVGFRAFVETDDGRKCLAMEECETSLGDIIETRMEENSGPLSVDIILKVVLDISKALDYLHNECHLLHGDVKSFNILIKDNFQIAKLCDFGVTLTVDDNGTVKGKGTYVGTDCWNAPEVLRSAEGPVTVKADIFALGLVIWEMLALSVPHVNMIISSGNNDDEYDENIDEKLQAVIGTRPTLPENLGKEYDKVIHIFNWCTEANYCIRPTARQLIDHIQSLCSKEDESVQ